MTDPPILRVPSTNTRYIGTNLPVTPDRPRPVTAYYNIPYATAPRFYPSRPLPLLPPSSNLIIPADTPSLFRRCPATGDVQNDEADEEAGLSLCIFRECGIAWAKLPCVMYFHGGSFNFGSSKERDLAGGVAWAGVRAGPVVMVGVNYRLGALGFHGGQGGDGMGNLGVQDALGAVEWVKVNSTALGVDPDRIILMGVSAGAHLVGHMVTWGVDVNAVIMESGSAMARAVLDAGHPRVRKQFGQLRGELGMAEGTADGDVLGRASVGHWEEVTRAAGRVWSGNARALTWPFQPVIDGVILRKPPTEIWKTGCFKMPILTGFCTDEGAVFVPGDLQSTQEFVGYFRELLPGLTERDCEELIQLYPGPEVPNGPFSMDPPPGLSRQWWRLQRAYGDWAYKCPVMLTAETTPNTRVYEWAALNGKNRVAEHTLESPSVAGVPRGGPGMAEVTKAVNTLFSEFYSGKMGKNGIDWPVWGANGRRMIMVFGEGNDELAGGKERGVPWRLREVTEREIRVARFWGGSEGT